MTPDTCFACDRLVMEFEDQFDLLQPYVLPRGHPAIDAGAIGYVHPKCLFESGWGRSWSVARYGHATSVLGQREVGSAPGLVALLNDRVMDLSIYREDGNSFHFSKKDDLRAGRAVPGGVLLPVKEDFNLELPDEHRDVIAAMHEKFDARRPFAILDLYDALGLRDTVMCPVALERGVLRRARAMDPKYRATWAECTAHYARFVPDDVLALARSVLER